jgi:dolichol-phosphate mannosyltransferase
LRATSDDETEQRDAAAPLGRSTTWRGRRQLEELTGDRRATARRFIKFGLVGLSGVPVTLLANYLLHAVAGLPLTLSTALAVEVAIFTNFLGNHLWTFADSDARARTLPRVEQQPVVGPIVTWALRPGVRRFAKFNAVSLVGLVITTAVTTFTASHYGTELREIAGPYYFLLANLTGIAVAMVWNFLANAVWTWA